MHTAPLMGVLHVFKRCRMPLRLPLPKDCITSNSKFYNSNLPQNNYLNKATFILLFSSILGSLLIFILKYFFAITVFQDEILRNYFLYLSLLFPFLILHGFINEFFRGSLQFIKYGLFTFILPALILVLLIFILKYNEKLNEAYLFLSYLLGFTLVVLLSLKYFPYRQKLSKVYPTKDLFKLSLPMLFSSTFIFLTNWTDIFMLGILVPKQDVGIYNAAWKIATLTVIVINVINIILGPQIAKLFESNDITGLKRKVQQATQLVTLFTIPLIVAILIFRKPLLNMFGEAYLEGEITLIILGIGMLFNALSGSVTLVLNMTNKQIALRNFTIIAAFSNIILNYFLIKQYGIIGAALATTITTILLNILGIRSIKRTFNFYPFSLKIKL